MKIEFRTLTALLAVLLAFTGNLSLGNSAKAEAAEAMEAYRKFLSEDTIRWVDEEPLFARGVQFMTQDLNGDGVPELIVHNREYPEFGRFGIFTYHGFVDDVAGSEELGSYYPGTGVLVLPYVVTKTSGEISKRQDLYVHFPDAAELSTSEQLVNWQLQIGLHETLANGEERFYWQGIYEKERQDEWAVASTVQVDQETFEANLLSLTGDAVQTPLEANWLDNREENLNQYLQ